MNILTDELKRLTLHLLKHLEATGQTVLKRGLEASYSAY